MYAIALRYRQLKFIRYTLLKVHLVPDNMSSLGLYRSVRELHIAFTHRKWRATNKGTSLRQALIALVFKMTVMLARIIGDLVDLAERPLLSSVTVVFIAKVHTSRPSL